MIWKDVVGFEDRYKVSSAGLVYSKHKNQLKATKKNNRGYVQVSLHKDGKEHMLLLHRVVAMAFIPNPNNLPQINHIDEDKENNRVSNLEWCTNIYNRRHGTGYSRSCAGHDYKAMGLANGRPVAMYSIDGKLCGEFVSVKTAQDETGINEANIRQSCYKTRRTAGGFRWEYCSPDDANRVKAEAGANKLLLSGSKFRFEAVI